MDIYEVSKQQLNKIGGDSTTLSTTYEVKRAQVEKLGGDLTKVNDIYTAELEVLDKIGGGGDILDTYDAGSFTENGQYTVPTPEPYDGMKNVSLEVNVPSPQLQTRTIDITENGTTVVTPTSSKYYGLESVTINVNAAATILTMTQEEYDAISFPDKNTIYLIKG